MGYGLLFLKRVGFRSLGACGVVGCKLVSFEKGDRSKGQTNAEPYQPSYGSQ